MDIQKVSEDARWHIFPATLSDAAQEWYFKFPASSIDSWEQFVQDFYKQFYAGRIHPTEANQLVDIRAERRRVSEGAHSEIHASNIPSQDRGG